MATVAEFTLAPDEFPLGSLFDAVPEATVVLEPVVPEGGDVVSYFWVLDADCEAAVRQVRDQRPIRDVRLVECVDRECLLRCRWETGSQCVFDALVGPAVTLRCALGTSDGWTLEVRGDTQGDVATFRERCREADVQVELRTLNGLRPLEARHALTEKQRRAIFLAYEHGYFNSPREATLAEVADELDISQQALASRLRRGTRRLLEQVFDDPPVTDPPRCRV